MIAFLRRARDQVRKTFFVVNKMDLLRDAEEEEVLAFVSAASREG
jgi:hypothetical protein